MTRKLEFAISTNIRLITKVSNHKTTSIEHTKRKLLQINSLLYHLDCLLVVNYLQLLHWSNQAPWRHHIVNLDILYSTWKSKRAKQANYSFNLQMWKIRSWKSRWGYINVNYWNYNRGILPKKYIAPRERIWTTNRIHQN